MFVFIYLSISLSLSLHRPLREFSILLNASEGQLAFYLYLFICFCNGKWWKSMEKPRCWEWWGDLMSTETSEHFKFGMALEQGGDSWKLLDQLPQVISVLHHLVLHPHLTFAGSVTERNRKWANKSTEKKSHTYSMQQKMHNMIGTRIGKGS